MIQLDAQYPGYGLARHKGYGTALHQTTLQSLGPCPIHRQSFAPIRARLF
jgi:ribonuclease HII